MAADSTALAREAKAFFNARAALAQLGVLVYRSHPDDGKSAYFSVASGGGRVRMHPDARSLRELAAALTAGGGH
jgi:hypothetical protein